MLPRWESSQPVLHAAHGAGNWIGAASALIHGDYIYLAYRDRHPVDQGRGNRAYVARSPADSGIHFEVLSVIDKADMDAESLERPALDVTPGGDWDLYLSCATFNSKHWRIERLRADDPASFRAQTRDLYSPPHDLSFWQAAIRTRDDPDRAQVEAALAGDDILLIDLLYGDQEGGQRTISRFSIAQYPGTDHQNEWSPAVVNHWYLDREGPR